VRRPGALDKPFRATDPLPMTDIRRDGPADRACDVLIVGGGLAGLTLAAALGGAGVDTILVDRESADARLLDTFDGRTTAVAFGTKRIVEAAGLWAHVPAAATGAILDIRVTDERSPLFLHYDHREVGDEPFGWIVENRTLRRAAFARLAQLQTVAHLAPAEVTDLARTATRVRATLGDGTTVDARLVVGADGRHSTVRRWAGIGTSGWAYAQTAIVCTIDHEYPHHGVALEHFLPPGPFAVLPMAGNRASVVWTERRRDAQAVLAMPEERFLLELRRRAGDWLGRVRTVGPKFAYPLSLLHADAYAADRVALVSEAAHAMHPIAGQGLNVGLRDVAALAEVIVDAHRLGLDPGGADALARYERWRRPDTLMLLAVTDGLNRLFANRIAPLKLARDVGLAVVNRTPPLKRFLMRSAMGTTGDLPRLARGEAL
jgi:2-octaprenyl-6-methoxyphenol hydroxylase